MHRYKKIVITGANGFVAKHLRKYLSEKNIQLISISRNNFKKFKNELKIVSKNYNEINLLQKIQNSDALIHLIGIGKQSVTVDYNMINVELTKNIINLCKKAKIKKIVYTSGLGVSSNSSTGYFISKYNAEKIIISSGLDYTIFRPSYIVGKDDHFTKYLKKQIKHGEIKIPGSGNYRIQPIYIDDVVEIIFQSIFQSKFTNKIIDLVGPNDLSFKKYVQLFSKRSQTSIKKINLEYAYRAAISNPKSDFGIDDLHILIGNFGGNHQKLRELTEIKFHSILELLETGKLF
ncbi:MAG: NAD-dependent epimerase/dehydratase family protein [Nitrosopumilus sp.]|nr:NAD-dependent epimerase/dehydratase family protein [Nitrosopumilus sp.]